MQTIDAPIDSERIYDFLVQQALRDVHDDDALHQLAIACVSRTLVAGESWYPEVDGTAHVCLVMAGLCLARTATGLPQVLQNGDGLALRAQRTISDDVRITGVEPCVLVHFAEPDYPVAAGDGWPGFDQLLTSLTAAGMQTSGVDAKSEAEARQHAEPDEKPAEVDDEAELSPKPDKAIGFLQEPVSHLMTSEPLTVVSSDTIQHAAGLMRDRHISCLPVVDAGRLVGLVTEADMTARVAATGRAVGDPVATVMTPDPIAVHGDTSVFDLISLLTARQVAHAPVVEAGRLIGVITQTDLVRRQTASSLFLIHDIGTLQSSAEIADIVRQVPDLLRNVVDGGGKAMQTGRMISAVTDAVTRRLIELAEQKLGPAPGAYVWLACGSQGRQEQTGATDQDNALVISDEVDLATHGAWFEAFADYVCSVLDEVGYVFCPGNMMAMNERWRKPLRLWQQDFRHWIDNPGPEAQMLVSVMFDLRPIHGDVALFTALQSEALRAAGNSSIFIAHLTSNALTHRVPLGLFGRLATERHGEHRNRIDLKHRGAVPIIDLARVHALASGVTAVNTVERLRAHNDDSIISASGVRDLLDAYEFISMLRLTHQAEQARAGVPLDNFIDPANRSALELDRLRHALRVIRDIQAALGNRFAAAGRG